MAKNDFVYKQKAFCCCTKLFSLFIVAGCKEEKENAVLKIYDATFYAHVGYFLFRR
jgi:hypothetical protein